MTDFLQAVAAAGYSTTPTPPASVDPVAARMLVNVEKAAGIALAGDVLLVALDEVPSPARIAELEAATGMGITITVTTSEILTGLRAAAARTGIDGASRTLSAVLTEAAQAGASDVLLTAGRRPAVRTAGTIATLETFPHMASADISHAQAWLLGTSGRHRGVVTLGSSRWRVHHSPSENSSSMALRRLPGAPVRAEDLHAPVALVSAATAPHGLVVVASGPGGGKTTTAAALLDRINTVRSAHIVTIGDPVEYQHRARQSIITELSVGPDIADVPQGVERAQMLAADVIHLDIRTVHEARAALAAAVSGHLVIASVGAVSAANALRHLVSLFEPAERLWAQQSLAATLRVATAQQLVPTTTGTTAAVFEVLSPSEPARAHIGAGQLDHLQAVLENEAGEAMSSMERSLAMHVAAGRVHSATARQVAPNAALFDQHLAVTTTGAGAQHLPAPARELQEPPAGRRAKVKAAAPAPAPTPAPQAPAQAAPTRATLRARDS